MAFCGGIEIQADDIGHLLQKLRISGQLEGPAAVGLEVVATPDVAHGGFADPLRLGHEATTPLRHALGLGLQSGIDDLLNFLCPIARFAAASRGDLPETLRAALGKAGAPQGDGRTTHREALRNGVVGLPFGCGQHNLATQGDLAGGAESSVPLLQLSSLSLFQGQGGQGTWHAKTIAQALYVVKIFVVHIGYLFSRHYTSPALCTSPVWSGRRIGGQNLRVVSFSGSPRLREKSLGEMIPVAKPMCC